MKILDIKSGVQRPKILLNEKDVADASASTCNDSRPANLRLIMRISWAARRNKRKGAWCSIFGRQIKTTLQGADIA